MFIGGVGHTLDFEPTPHHIPLRLSLNRAEARRCIYDGVSSISSCLCTICAGTAFGDVAGRNCGPAGLTVAMECVPRFISNPGRYILIPKIV